MSIREKLAINIDPVNGVVAYQFKDVMNAEELEQAIHLITSSLHMLPMQSFSIIEDYRLLADPDNPMFMKDWGKKATALFDEYRLRDGERKNGRKVARLCATPEMKMKDWEFYRQLGYDKIDFIQMFYEMSDEETRHVCYRWLGISNNPLIDSVKIQRKF